MLIIISVTNNTKCQWHWQYILFVTDEKKIINFARSTRNNNNRRDGEDCIKLRQLKGEITSLSNKCYSALPRRCFVCFKQRIFIASTKRLTML